MAKNSFYFVICVIFNGLLLAHAFKISENNTLAQKEVEDVDTILEELDNKRADTPNPVFISAMQQMDSSTAYATAFEGIQGVFAEVAYDRLSENEDEEYNEDLMNKELTKAGYGAFLQSTSKAEFGKWLKQKWNDAKAIGKKALGKIKSIASKSGFMTKIKQMFKEQALPKAKELFKDLSVRELPAVEQFFADSLQKLDPAVRKVASSAALALFNQFEKYLGTDIPDSIFVQGGERINVSESVADVDDEPKSKTIKSKKSSMSDEDDDDEEEDESFLQKRVKRSKGRKSKSKSRKTGINRDVRIKKKSKKSSVRDASPEVIQDWKDALKSMKSNAN